MKPTHDGDWQSWERHWRNQSGGSLNRYRGSGTIASRYRRYSADLLTRLDKEKIEPPARALELGCGTGTMSLYLSAAGYRVGLLDRSPTAMKICKKNFLKVKQLDTAEVKIFPIDILSMITWEFFTIVHSVGTLEHFIDPKPVLKVANDLLIKGGLGWHVIINDDGAGNRTSYGADFYLKAMSTLGQASACMVGYTQKHMLLLTWIKQ